MSLALARPGRAMTIDPQRLFYDMRLAVREERLQQKEDRLQRQEARFDA